MEYQNSVEYLIRERTSVRAYDKRPIESDKAELLSAYLNEKSSEAKSGLRFICLSQYGNGGSERLGTYGMIAGAKDFIAVIADSKTYDAVEIGYLFEKIILYATGLGLGTCWLGGTFDRAAFDKVLKIREGEFIPIVSPVGYTRDRRSLAESMVRRSVKADQRLPFGELFFDMSPEKPLSEESSGAFRLPLEMVRLAPSASNKQPWRVVKDGIALHFYLARTKGYGIVRYDVQLNDIGIAMCHFELAAKEHGLSGEWIREDRPAADWIYVVSWKEKTEQI